MGRGVVCINLGWNRGVSADRAGVVGIDMFIAFTDRKFNRDVVRQACVGLNLRMRGRRSSLFGGAGTW